MIKILSTLVAIFILMNSPSAWTADKPLKNESVEKVQMLEKPVKLPLVFTQKDFARMIVSQFGWADGLPKDPADRDYYVILGGKRTFRYEAENAYNPKTDRVTIRDFNLYGPFTGKGWMLGISQPTTANFTMLVPISGEYTLKGVVRGTGFVWRVGGKEFTGGSADKKFKTVDFGTIALKAGITQASTILPVEGGIDSFSLVANDYRAIQPFAGWRFREPLTAVRLAEVGVSMMDLYQRLPEDHRNPVKPIEVSEAALSPKNVLATEEAFFGPFKSRTWLRATYRGTTLQIPIKIAESGFYIVQARVMGDSISGDVNGTPYSVTGSPVLGVLVDLGLFRLESGDNMVTLKLPPMGGIDTIELTQKDASSVEFMKLGEITGDPDRVVKADEALAYIKTIGEKYPVRK